MKCLIICFRVRDGIGDVTPVDSVYVCCVMVPEQGLMYAISCWYRLYSICMRLVVGVACTIRCMRLVVLYFVRYNSMMYALCFWYRLCNKMYESSCLYRLYGMIYAPCWL